MAYGSMTLEEFRRGKNTGRKRQKKDIKLGNYPVQGLPDPTGRSKSWVEGYKRGYYEQGQGDLVDLT